VNALVEHGLLAFTCRLDFEAAFACLALVPSSPDIHCGSMPLWADPEAGENITEALQVLDTYKKTDLSKGNNPYRISEAN
jgi:hypothetical protein